MDHFGEGAPGTIALFDRVGILEGACCVDVGCGGGHASRELARRVGERGSVVGIDLDPDVLELATAEVSAAAITNIEFRCCDATQVEGSGYDVAYARCLLSHVADPAEVLASIVTMLPTQQRSWACHGWCRHGGRRHKPREHDVEVRRAGGANEAGGSAETCAERVLAKATGAAQPAMSRTTCAGPSPTSTDCSIRKWSSHVTRSRPVARSDVHR